jgi:hypothetical protein
VKRLLRNELHKEKAASNGRLFHRTAERSAGYLVAETCNHLKLLFQAWLGAQRQAHTA